MKLKMHKQFLKRSPWFIFHKRLEKKSTDIETKVKLKRVRLIWFYEWKRIRTVSP